MFRRLSHILTALLLSALLATPALAQDSDGGPLARLPVERHTLDNGLRVVLSPDRTIPTVAVAVYYDVGSRNEEVGR